MARTLLDGARALRLTAFDGLLQDLRFALRSLRRNPGFSTVAIVVLAVAIGANTAIFSIVNMLLLRPLVVEEPERLVGLYPKSLVDPDEYRGCRLAVGRSEEEARLELESIGAQLAADFPGVNRDFTLVHAPTARLSMSTRPITADPFCGDPSRWRLAPSVGGELTYLTSRRDLQWKIPVRSFWEAFASDGRLDPSLHREARQPGTFDLSSSVMSPAEVGSLSVSRSLDRAEEARTTFS